jgi:hypothetical protein
MLRRSAFDARIGAAGSRRLDNGGGTALTLYSEGFGGRFEGNLGLDPGLGADL